MSSNKNKVMSKKIHTIILYLFTFTLLLECNSVYFVNDRKVSQVVLLSSILLLLCLLIRSKIKFSLKPIAPFCCFLYIAWALIMYFNGTGDNGYILKFFGFLPMVTLYLAFGGFDRFRELLHCLVNLMLFISCISLFFYLFGTVLKLLPSTNVVYTDWSGTFFPTWYNVYYEAQPFRNCGIYPEAPMFNYTLVIALLSEYFVMHRNKWKIIILVTTILTSTSTTGQFVLLALVFIHVLGKFHNGSLSQQQTAIIRFICVLTTILLIYVGNTIMEMKSQTSSYEVRLEYINKALNVFLNNVWLGSGYGKNLFGSSNSLFVLMADGGLFMMAFYGYSLLLWPFVQIAKKQYRLAIMYLLYFCVFSITIILYTELSLLIIAYPLSRILELKKKVILLK